MKTFFAQIETGMIIKNHFCQIDFYLSR